MDVKGVCVFFHVSLLLMCRCGFGGTERTHEINCQRGYGLLKPTDITCLPVDRLMTCTWLLGIQYDNRSVIDTSCNYIRTEESVRMYFSQNISSGSNGYESWTPCQIQDPTSCSHLHDSDEFYVMVIVNNNKLNTCTGFSIEKIKSKVPEYMDHEIADMKHLVLVGVLSAIGLCTLANGILLMFLWNHYSKPRRDLSLRSYDEFDEDLVLESHPSEKQKINRQHKELSAEIVPAGSLGLHTKTISDEVHDLQKITRLDGEDSWTECINWKCDKLALELLKDNVLPTDSELQSICCVFGKRSETLRNVCAKICTTIERELKNTSKVWPAYTLSSGKIVFVVESEMTLFIDRDFEIHSHISLEKESKIVMLREKEILELCYDKYGVAKFEMLRQTISKYAEKLMDKHKFINAITPGVAKSIGYLTSGQHKLIETPCISIYVYKKERNLIPLGEDPIPRLIDDFPTDVLEGKFDFFCKGSNDFHEVIKIGCGIHAGVRTDNGDTIGGTLGAFVKHETFDLCCITSAHVVLSYEQLQLTKKYSYAQFGEKETKKVFQPFCEQSETFGKVVAASHTEGGHRAPGVEVALIQIQSRKPTSGAFPHANTGSDLDFVFDSGNVIDANLLRPKTEVYKFGMRTRQTTGYIGQHGAAVRVGSNPFDDSNFGIRLYNQLEIFPKDNSSFAEIGDSGALVFIGHPECAAAIGILEGGLPNGIILVTPIIDVLRALKCPRYLYRFEQDLKCSRYLYSRLEQDSDSGTNIQCPDSAEGGNVEEDMDLN